MQTPSISGAGRPAGRRYNCERETGRGKKKRVGDSDAWLVQNCSIGACSMPAGHEGELVVGQQP